MDKYVVLNQKKKHVKTKIIALYCHKVITTMEAQ
jgi:hypothetical protein